MTRSLKKKWQVKSWHIRKAKHLVWFFLSPLSLTYVFFTYKNRHIGFNLCNRHCSYICNFSPSCTIFPLKVVEIPLLHFTALVSISSQERCKNMQVIKADYAQKALLLCMSGVEPKWASRLCKRSPIIAIFRYLFLYIYMYMIISDYIKVASHNYLKKLEKTPYLSLTESWF